MPEIVGAHLFLFDGERIQAVIEHGNVRLPGGKRKPGENARDCLLRELDEELGLGEVLRMLVDSATTAVFIHRSQKKPWQYAAQRVYDFEFPPMLPGCDLGSYVVMKRMRVEACRGLQFKLWNEFQDHHQMLSLIDLTLVEHLQTEEDWLYGSVESKLPVRQHF